MSCWDKIDCSLLGRASHLTYFSTAIVRAAERAWGAQGKIYVLTALIEYLTVLLEYINLLGPLSSVGPRAKCPSCHPPLGGPGHRHYMNTCSLFESIRSWRHGRQVFFKWLLNLNHCHCWRVTSEVLSQTNTENIGEIKNWRFYFNSPICQI